MPSYLTVMETEQRVSPELLCVAHVILEDLMLRSTSGSLDWTQEISCVRIRYYSHYLIKRNKPFRKSVCLFFLCVSFSNVFLFFVSVFSRSSPNNANNNL